RSGWIRRGWCAFSAEGRTSGGGGRGGYGREVRTVSCCGVTEGDGKGWGVREAEAGYKGVGKGGERCGLAAPAPAAGEKEDAEGEEERCGGLGRRQNDGEA